MTPNQYYDSLRANKLIEELEKRDIEGFYCCSKADALTKLFTFIPRGSSISRGGSLTLDEIGLTEAMANGKYRFIDPKSGKGAYEKERLAHEAMQADFFLMSANAVSMTGELVNADGIGNRVAALIFGPRNVIVVAGMNKVEPDLGSAIRKVRTKTAEKCLTLFKQDYISYDELQQSAKRAVSHLVVTSQSVYKGRIKVILVGETLGI
jgi:hypothetical protein